MANPNIVNVTSILGKTAVNTDQSTALTIAKVDNKVLKINAIYVSNDTASAVTSSITFNGKQLINVSVPGNSTLDVLSKSIYLTDDAGNSLVCSAATGLDYVVSYEEIS